MFDKINTHNWLELPQNVRNHLVSVFGIVKTGGAEIRDNIVISDGVTNQDLLVITLEKMAEYVKDSVDLGFPRLWEITLAKVKYELNPPQFEITTDGLLIDVNPETTKVPYCITCPSTKGRHRKGCPKFK